MAFGKLLEIYLKQLSPHTATSPHVFLYLGTLVKLFYASIVLASLSELEVIPWVGLPCPAVCVWTLCLLPSQHLVYFLPRPGKFYNGYLFIYLFIAPPINAQDLLLVLGCLNPG